MRSDYEAWLRSESYDAGTVAAQLARVSRVEAHYGDLDAHYAADRLASLMETLRYSTDDERRARANPTHIPINGNLRNNLASYRSALSFYRRFRDSGRTPVAASDATPARARPRPSLRRSPNLIPPPEHARTLAEFGFDGQTALAALIGASRYGTVAQAVASLAVFSHPQTVAQTRGQALFPTIRGTPGEFVEIDGRRLMSDDNRSPTDAFRWANGLGTRSRDTQLNHVYSVSRNPDAYTSLANLVLTPAFLAKLTDTNAAVQDLLRWRAYDLYGWTPAGHEAPQRPADYAALEWAVPLPPTADLPARLEAALQRTPKSRTTIAARRLGWLFGEARHEQDGLPVQHGI